MEQGVERTLRDVTMTFRLVVMCQVERRELTFPQANRQYGIQSHSTVCLWMRKHGRIGWSPGASSAAMPIDRTPTALTPDQRIRQLEVQLRDEREKTQLFEKVIEVLEKDFGVVVKKPSGGSCRKSSSRRLACTGPASNEAAAVRRTTRV